MNGGRMDWLRKKDTGLWVRIVVLVAITAALSIINQNFLGSYNIASLLETAALLLVMSIGMTFVLLIGSIDLSLGAMVSCGAVVLVKLLEAVGVWAYPIIMALGLMAGFVNGIIFVKLKIPSFITTLATMSVYTSLSLIISNATPLQISPSLKPLTSWVNVRVGAVPLVFILACIVLAIFAIVQSKTKFGQCCYAVGANETAANMAGIRVDRTKTLVFMIAGLCYALGAIIITTRLMSGVPTVGTTYTLLAISAVALGGTSLGGGKGGVLLTLFGTMLSVVINNGMVVIGIDVYWQQIVYGAIIIFSLAMSVDRRKTDLVVK